jgi:hypothetical protein
MKVFLVQEVEPSASPARSYLVQEVEPSASSGEVYQGQGQKNHSRTDLMTGNCTNGNRNYTTLI